MFIVGNIIEIHKKWLHVLLRREFNTDLLLQFPKDMLTEQQKEMICMGLCVRFDPDIEKIEFMTAEGNPLWV